MTKLLNRDLTHRETLEMTHEHIINLTSKVKVKYIHLDSGQAMFYDDVTYD